MVQVDRLTTRLRELGGVSSQAHVNPLHGAAVAAGRGEDDPGEQGGAGVSLACGSLSITEVTHLQTKLIYNRRVSDLTYIAVPVRLTAAGVILQTDRSWVVTVGAVSAS